MFSPLDAYYGTDGCISGDERDGNERAIFKMQSFHLRIALINSQNLKPKTM